MSLEIPVLLLFIVKYFFGLFLPSFFIFQSRVSDKYLIAVSGFASYILPGGFLLLGHLVGRPELTLVFCGFYAFLGYICGYRFQSWRAIPNSLKGLAVSAVIGFSLWSLFTYPSYFKDSFYVDTWWNVALTGEIKNNFPPIFPMWATDTTTFLYHYLPNLLIAGISRIASVPVAEMSFYYFPILVWWTLCCTFFSGIKTSLEVATKLISLFTLCVFMNYSWNPIISYTLHLSHAASNFFWGLPIFVFLILMWIRYLPLRMRFAGLSIVTKMTLSLTVILISIGLYFTKASTGLFFAIADLSIAPAYFFWRKKRKISLPAAIITGLHLSLASFTIILPTLLFPSTKALTSSALIVRDKLSGFEGSTWALILFFFIFPYAIFIFRRNSKWLTLIYQILFIAALNHVIIFSQISHPTFSEFYLVFNSFIVGVVLLSIIPAKKWAFKVAPTMGVFIFLSCTLLPLDFKAFNFNRQLNIIQDNYDSTSGYSDDTNDIVRFRALMDNSKSSTIFNLVTTCQNPIVSSLLEKRTLFECPASIGDRDFISIQERKKETLNELKSSEVSCPSFIKDFPSTYLLVRNSEVSEQLSRVCDMIIISKGKNLTLLKDIAHF